MRTVSIHLLLLLCSVARCQSIYTADRWQWGMGLTAATLNFHQNGITGFCFPVSYNLIQSEHSSLSLGTNLKIGTEDENGLLFPVVIGAAFASAVDPNLDPSLNHQVAVYADFPLLLHYNFGVGAHRSFRSSTDNRGFYIGGGFTQTFTGYTSPKTGQAAQTDFRAWVADGGLRFRLNTSTGLDLGLAISQPFRAPIGPIDRPLLFQFNIALISL